MAFIVFEGLDGAGKSSLIQAAVEAVETSSKNSNRTKVLLTREPGGTPLAEELRHMLIRTKGESPVPRAEMLLYAASRAQHVDKVIKPALLNGQWVICDRFTASSIAFQNGGRGLDLNAIEWLNQFATDSLTPDLTVLLDLSVEESQRRMKNRFLTQGTQADRFEKEAIDFHQRVRDSYLEQAKHSKNWLVLNSSQSPQELKKQLILALESRGWI